MHVVRGHILFDGHFSFMQCLLIFITMKEIKFINLLNGGKDLQQFEHFCALWFVYYFYHYVIIVFIAMKMILIKIFFP